MDQEQGFGSGEVRREGCGGGGGGGGEEGEAVERCGGAQRYTGNKSMCDHVKTQCSYKW